MCIQEEDYNLVKAQLMQKILKLLKSSWILGHSTEKLKYVPLKIAQMEMFSLGKSEKIFQIKKFLQ